MEEKNGKSAKSERKKTNYGREKRNISQIREKMTYYGREIRKIRQIQEKKTLIMGEKNLYQSEKK